MSEYEKFEIKVKPLDLSKYDNYKEDYFYN